MNLFKKISVVLIITLIHQFIITSATAQTPDQFKYQAVLRNADGTIMANEAVTVDISILKGSATGTSVFTEQHSVTTTAQGLINLNIGSVSDLSVVDFSADTYFIEISVNSTVMGTSQLLSVPYALQAKNVENVDYSQITNTPTLFDGDYNSLSNLPTLFDGAFGSLTGTPTTISGYGITDAFDGTWASLTGKPTFAAVATSGSYNDLSDKPANATTSTDGFMSSADKTKLDGLSNADGSETHVTAGTNVTVTGAGTSADPYVINADDQTPAHYVGELYGGGIVYWVDQTGEHGLIASLDDLDGGSGVAWSATDNVEIGASAQSFYDGASNTAAIVAQDNTAGYAATLCDSYTGGSFSDWYLPANQELRYLESSSLIINQVLANDGNGATNGLNLSNSSPYGYYWSSTEYSLSNAWILSLRGGYVGAYDKGNPYRVRAVRAF